MTSVFGLPQKSFRTRLLIAIVLLGLVPLLIWAVFAYLGSLGLVSRFLEREIDHKVSEAAAKLEAVKAQNRMLVAALAQELTRKPSTEWAKVLANLTESVPEIYDAHILNITDQSIHDSVQTEIDADETGHEILLSQKLHKPALCSVMLIPVGHSTTKSSKNLLHTLEAQQKVTICRLIDSLLRELARTQIGRTGYLFVVDNRTQIIAHPSLQFQSLGIPELESKLLKFAVTNANEAQSFGFAHDRRSYVGYHQQLDNGWRILALHPKTELLSWATDFLIWPIGLGILAFALVSLFAGIVVYRLTRPLMQLTSATQDLGPDNLHIRLPVRSGDELGRLSQSFNEMAARLDQAFSSLQEKESELERSKANLEKQILEQSEQLLYSTKMSSLGEMAGGIAHEINNPLAIISLRAQRLKEQVERGEANRDVILESLEKIESTCLRINQIVRALRSFSRDGSKDPMLLENLSSIISEAVTLCSEFLKTHGIHLDVICPESIEIECQPVQIAQVLLNLLTNARDAVIDRRQAWIRLEAKIIADNVEIKVTDNGIGIPKELQDKIMQPFFTTKSVGSGTGLGLSISKGIIQQHHGDLFYNKENPETQFIIQLPLRQPERINPSKPV